jgi:ribonuclease HI
MPWVRARLKSQNQTVFARATAAGELAAESGTVEIRYKANDGRLYRARVDNVAVTDAAVLPDSTCAEAQAVTATKRPAAGAKAAGSSGGAGGPLPANALVAYTDGACSGNPGPAGLGVVLIDGAAMTEVSEYLGQGTNNIAELTAVLRAVERAAGSDRPLVVHTDSQYAIGVLSKGWKAKANQQLIADIRQALTARPGVRLVYVPGHAGVPMNERADQLAREAVSSRRSRVALPRT